MTDGPDWAETFAAIKNPPGKSAVGNTRPGMDQVKAWQEFQQQRTGADVAVAVGAVDTGDDFDGWGAVTEWAQDVGDGIGGAVNQVTTLANNLLTAAGTVIGNIGAVVVDGLGNALQDVWDAIGAGLGGATTGHNAASLNAQAVQLALTAQDAEAAAYAAQWSLQQLTGGGSTGGGGVTFDMDITGADGDALSATDWATASNMVVRVNGSVSAMGITAGTTVGVISYANCAHQYLSDSQSIAAVLGPKGDSVAATILHFHCNSTYTRGMYLSIVTTGVTFGYFTGALGSRTYTPLTGGTLTRSMTSGTRVEARDSGTNSYAILVNGIPSLTVNDPGAHAVAGDFYAQVTETSRTVIYNPGLPWQTTGTNYSFQLASILLSDYIIPTVVGSTAAMYRTSTGTVSLNASPNAVLGSSFFGVVDYASADITVDLANSKFTVSKAGTYLIGLRAIIDTGTNTTNTQEVTPLLYVNGSIAKWGNPATAVYVVGNNGSLWRAKPDAMDTTFRKYLQAGDYVQPGWNNQHISSGTLTGEATGTQTFFDITRIGD